MVLGFYYRYTHFFPRPQTAHPGFYYLFFLGLCLCAGHSQAQPETSSCVHLAPEWLHPLPAGSRKMAPWRGRSFLCGSCLATPMMHPGCSQSPYHNMHQSGHSPQPHFHLGQQPTLPSHRSCSFSTHRPRSYEAPFWAWRQHFHGGRSSQGPLLIS